MFEKLSSYNVVNNLVPGAILAVALRAAGVPLVGPDKLGTFLVLAHALGSISSRVGSLLLDPALERSKWLPEKDYPAYVAACKVDPKMDAIVETANAYRTIATAGGMFFLILGSHSLASKLGLESRDLVVAAAVGVTALFIISYKKQYGYVSARVTANRPTK